MSIKLVFTATLVCTKRTLLLQKGHFSSQKGTLGPIKKFRGGGGHVPPSYAPGPPFFYLIKVFQLIIGSVCRIIKNSIKGNFFKCKNYVLSI